MQARNLIITVFYGYTQTGKTTLLTSSLAASHSGKLLTKNTDKALTISEKSEFNEGGKSYFSLGTAGGGKSKIDKFLNGEVVEKTEEGDYREFRFDIGLGGESFECKTIDYAGELAPAYDTKNVNYLNVSKVLNKAHCLYLVFDLSLGESFTRLDDSKSELRRGSIEAAIKAYNEFTKQRGSWPIVILVNKADRLSSEKNMSLEVEKRIEELNGDIIKGKKLFIDEFGSAARSLCESDNVKIVFVSSLGSKPRVRNMANGSEAYVIDCVDTWYPLGLADAFEIGLFEAHKKITRKLKRNIVIKRAPYYAVLVLLLLTIFFIYKRDMGVVKDLLALESSYNSREIEISKLLDKSESVNSWRYPFIYLPAKVTLFGTIPHTDASKDFKRVYDRAKYYYALEGVNRLDDKNLNIEYSFNNKKFNDVEKELLDLDSEWDSMFVLLDKMPSEGDQSLSEINRLKKMVFHGKNNLYLNAIDALWESADYNEIDIETAEVQIQYYMDKIVKNKNIMPLRNSYSDKNILKTAEKKYLDGMCKSMYSDYQRDVQTSDEDTIQKTFPKLTKFCSVCSELPVSSVCDQLTNNAYEWDLLEAKILYDLYPKNGDLYGVTNKLIFHIKKYLKNSMQRKIATIDFNNQYYEEATTFMNWYGGLKNSYNIDRVGFRISPDYSDGYVRTENKVETYTYKDGWSTKTGSRNVEYKIPPHGKIIVKVDDNVIFSENYTGYSKNFIIEGFYLDWTPTTNILVSITNDDTKATRSMTFYGYEGLVKMSGRNVVGNGIELSVTGINIPPLKPSILPSVQLFKN